MTISVAEADRIFREHGLKPLDAHVLAKTPRRARCVFGHITTPSLNNLRRRPNAICRVCGDLEKGSRRRLEASVATARMENAGFEPLEPYVRSDLPWSCRCLSCGKVSRPDLEHASQGVGCTWCWSQRRGQSRRIADKAARAQMILSGYEPLGPYPGSGIPWRSRCVRCDHERCPTYDNVKQGMRCPCFSHGFDFHKPSHVYLVEHRIYGALKVGVTQALYHRKKGLRREGYDVSTMQIFGPCTGERALEVEACIIASWRSKGYADAIPSGIVGYTETAALSQVSRRDAESLIMRTLSTDGIAA